ncbi:TonB-dependent receptor [Adhaeribacter pallidiroseus]|uniref:Heterogeneous nuclear ribonucleoprotein A3 like protein n=1 Tax=Adhaeribacter pallidiroseus TaxID=2072847 RepID=A0A369QKF1_9BACT|nr:TonB-dependent receptor [Adhaeribacter pallidiroseus]RDC64800.1 Heterogeneous nuclear ribonucleoprotein A3 like protein [Adhaeribacter pallidiroseus]
MKIFFTLAIFLLSEAAWGQSFLLEGTVTDRKDNSPLPGATVLLLRLPDSTQSAVITDATGRFAFQQTPGRYLLRISFLSYQTVERPISLTNAPLNVGAIALSSDTRQLKEVQIIGKTPTAVQKGDTTELNARAFKTNPDANATDLIQKMPGINVQDGQVKAQGENVQRVLVDGKEFFGDDVNATLNNLPAEVIDKIQILEEQSEQAKVSGFDDGTRVKTLNIVTRADRRTGQFGRVYAGAGTDARYQVGGSLNMFKPGQRLTILGQSNSINQQNFSGEDLIGVSGGGGGGGRGGRGGGGGPGGGGFGGGNDFAVPQLNGITKTHSGGLNYSGQFGKKLEISGSYFGNYTDNDAYEKSFLQYVVNQRLPYNAESEINNSATQNHNHRLNFRLEYKIDSANTIFLRPRLSLQGRDALSGINRSRSLDTALVTETAGQSNSKSLGINFTNEFTLQHRFAKRGRSLSIGLGTSINNRNVDSYNQSETEQFNPDELISINQRNDQEVKGWSLTPSVSFSEPLSKLSQLQLNYSGTIQRNESDRRAYNFTDEEEGYNAFDPRFSNTFVNFNPQHRVGVGYRFRTQDNKINFNFNTSYQYSELNNEREFPTKNSFSRGFHNVVPNARLQYNITKQKNFRLFYRGATNPPSVDQLQDVVTLSNDSLRFTIGNPNLNQYYRHFANIRYSATNLEKASTFFIGLNASVNQNPIVNATIIADSTEVIFGVPLIRNQQITRPTNVNGQYNFNGFVNYGIPIKAIKTNVNVDANAGYNKNPGYLNGVLNYSYTQTYGVGLTLSSNISENLDFTLASNGNMNLTRNSASVGQNNNYYTINNRARLNWIFWKNFVLQSDFTQRIYSGLSANYNQNYSLWNVSVGKKFFPKRNGDLRLIVYDLLKQNNSIQRNIQPTYIEDVETRTLQRYFMLSFTYTIRQYNGNATGNNLNNPGNRGDRERRPGDFNPGNRDFGPGRSGGGPRN